MVKIIVACGSGVATSTLIASKVDEILDRRGEKAQVIQCSLHEAESLAVGAVMVLTAMGGLQLTGDVPVINAMPYITGMGAETVDAEINRILDKVKG